MSDSTVTAKSQTTVPKEVRQSLGAQPGDAPRCVAEGDHVRVKAAIPAFLSLQGKFKVGQGDVVKDVRQVRDCMGAGRARRALSLLHDQPARTTGAERHFPKLRLLRLQLPIPGLNAPR